MTLIYEDYIKYHNEYTKKYGSQTIVFLEVGSFFELYAIPNSDKKDDDDGKNSFIGCDMNAISRILDIQITRKNKKIKAGIIDTKATAAIVPQFVPVVVTNSESPVGIVLA